MAHKLKGTWTSLIVIRDTGEPVNDGLIDIELIDDGGGISKSRRRKGNDEFVLEGEADPSSDPQPRVTLKRKGADFPDYDGQLLYEVGSTMIIVGGVFRDTARLKRRNVQGEDTWVAVKQGS